MKVSLKSTDSLKQFTGTNDQGKTLQLSNDGSAPGPMQSVLMAVAGCSSIDIVMILEKMKQDLVNIEVEVEGERRDEIPRTFTKIHMHYILTGKDLNEKKIEKAIGLSTEKYCSVSKMLEKAAEISTSFEVISSK